MKSRPTQTNCQQEPPYPEHETVVFSIRFPDLTAHSPSSRCAIQEPHAISECGEFALKSPTGPVQPSHEQEKSGA